MNRLFYFKTAAIAGLFMAQLATQFGIQSTLSTLSTGFEVEAVMTGAMYSKVEVYRKGFLDGLNVARELQ